MVEPTVLPVIRIERAMESEEPYWRLIATAPKDGSRFLARDKGGDIYHCHWIQGDRDDETIDCWWDEQRDDEGCPAWWAPALPNPH